MDIRASDEDRQRVLAALERHTGAGRLTLDEFAARVEAACGARTLDDLAAVTRDLPQLDDGPRRDFLILVLIAAVVLVLLAGAMALRN
ncbi:DUF1707 SHOCT-like domain-containing protein [Jidongwangia harbinensis]|uniref:DUF1707 SHOCT-like domain-containing protein n=1 Tax=Jidongwangia harbinensis TaxID=2878561 RepID=UPI001CD944EC|nr:DUF1707 domain-containing protein [Jidongwangia harbinensis]MCA2218614.1 DUF1707 domain-containing protein [Jidongwangia harbinensis]